MLEWTAGQHREFLGDILKSGRHLLQLIVVVVLTAYAMKGDAEKAVAAGSDGYVSKPIETRTFAETIAGYLRKGAGAGKG